MSNLLPAAQLPAAVTRLTGRKSPSYQALYLAMVDGRIPHERSVTNRLSADPLDVCAYYRFPVINKDATIEP
jgi:hypothetical protein